MVEDGVSRLPEFLEAEEKRGHLCNLTDASGPPPPQTCANPTPRAYHITVRAGNFTPYLSSIVPYNNAHHESFVSIHKHPKRTCS